jgi:hypothetical protein
LAVLKPGDTLEIWDSADSSRRIHYSYGEPPDVVDKRAAPPIPRARKPDR